MCPRLQVGKVKRLNDFAEYCAGMGVAPQHLMRTNKVAADDARRVAQHERIKEKLERDVHTGIAQEAEAPSPADRAQYGSLAADLKRKAASEVVETEAELDRARSTARVSQVVDYCSSSCTA